ncbi:MAG: hypothetical protein CFE44_03105 [Burkholderiales bacterium PBB4]|nr:MAG: hypothetical protein CFE44_03105 [Burkholderiales bacterium PBB4]
MPLAAHQSAGVGIGWRYPHYAELLALKPPLDFLEVHPENFFGSGGAALAVLEQGRALYPVSLHGVALSLGSAMGLDPWHLEQLADLVERTEPIRVSDHACFARGLYRGQAVHASDLLPIPFTKASLNVLCRHIDQVQERLCRPFMVENLSAYIGWTAPPDEAVWLESEFLVTMARRTGCHLLVDVNNIYVNALNALAPTQDDADRAAQAEVACLSWLDAIDPILVGEIHLAGHCRVRDAHGDIVIDDHGSPVCEAVWRLYRHAVQRFGPVPTLIEWDTELPALQVLLNEADRARALVNARHTEALV